MIGSDFGISSSGLLKKRKREFIFSFFAVHIPIQYYFNLLVLNEYYISPFLSGIQFLSFLIDR